MLQSCQRPRGRRLAATLPLRGREPPQLADLRQLEAFLSQLWRILQQTILIVSGGGGYGYDGTVFGFKLRTGCVKNAVEQRCFVAQLDGSLEEGRSQFPIPSAGQIVGRVF